VAAVAAEYAGEVNFLGVAGRADVGAMEQFLADTGADNLTHVNDESGDIWTGFGVPTQPAFAYIDDDGSVELVVGRQGQQSLSAVAERLSAS
jgi:hypothetical protein